MSIFRKSIFFLSLFFFPLQLCFGQGERITNYAVQIQVQEDSSLLITEEISVIAAGRAIKRGIYRDFPTDYKQNGINYRVGFKVLEVLRGGKAENYHVKNHANGKRVYIGKKDVMLSPGSYTYTLRYKTNFQLGFFEEHDELYFNAIGHGWIFPIDSGNVSVLLPEGIPASDIRVEAYTGSQGSKAQNYAVDDILESFVSLRPTKPLGRREGFTIVVSWPKGFVTEPSTIERLLSLFWSNLDNVFGLVGLLALMIFYAFSWADVGKDPEKGTIIPRFEPPAGITPEGARYVLDMSYSKRSFTAFLYGLAIKGVIRLEEDSGTFEIHRGDHDSNDLTPTEAKVLHTILPSHLAFRKVDKKDWSIFQSASETVKKSLQAKHLEKTFLKNESYFFFGIAFSVGIGLLMFAVSGFNPDEFFDLINIGTCVVMLLLAGVFRSLIKAPTKMGRAIMDEIEGYKMYLETAERDRLGNLAPKEITMELYEKHLPYAVALGVDQEWTKNFENDLARRGQDPNEYRPNWYQGSRRWNDRSFLGSSLGDSLSSSIASSSSPPGSSSGSGGGGSSGGGGGGGGGGGW